MTWRMCLCRIFFCHRRTGLSNRRTFPYGEQQRRM